MDMNQIVLAGIAIAIYLGTSYWVFADVLRLPRMLQTHVAVVHRDLGGAGAFGWLGGCLVLWPIAFPRYLCYRGALIREHRVEYDAFHRQVTEGGLPFYLRRQALINGLYLVLVAFIPQMLLYKAQGTSVAFLCETGAWAGWALFVSGLVVLAVLAVERSIPGEARRRMAMALMPGFPLLVFSVLTAIFAIAHLGHLLAVARGQLLPAAGPWVSTATYGWILLLWMVPAVAVVNMVTEAFAPGLTAVFSSIRAIWRDDKSRPAGAA